jgi:hypothetical protein
MERRLSIEPGKADDLLARIDDLADLGISL